MSQYYQPRRTKNIYAPGGTLPFALSRSKIDLYLNCPRCFYMDRRLGVGQPPGFPFNLNSAVDTLLKKEFDGHRAAGTPHPMMAAYGLDAIPYAHPMMDEWRENFKGIRHVHTPTNLLITGAVDDIWVNPAGELIVVDYKSTAKEGEVSIDAPWQIAYKRQMEVYQWLLRRSGFTVSNTGYFVYVNGKLDAKAFDGKLEFHVKLIPYTGNDAWIEDALENIKECLESDTLPMPGNECDYCAYRKAAQEVLGDMMQKMEKALPSSGVSSSSLKIPRSPKSTKPSSDSAQLGFWG